MRQTWLWLNSSRCHGDAKKVHLLSSGVRRRWRRPNPCLSLPPSFSPFFSFFFHPSVVIIFKTLFLDLSLQLQSACHRFLLHGIISDSHVLVCRCLVSVRLKDGGEKNCSRRLSITCANRVYTGERKVQCVKFG